MKRTPPTNSSIPKESTTQRANKRHAPSSSPGTQLPIDQFKMISREDIKEIVQEAIQSQMTELVSQIGDSVTKSIKRELGLIRKEMEEVKESISFMEDKYEIAISGYQEMDKEVKVLKEENKNMLHSLELLKNKVNILEQNSRSNNLEIQCVPEAKNENLLAIMMQSVKTVGHKISEDAIQQCIRVSKLDKSSTRPRSIIVQMSSPQRRDELLAKIIKYNKAHPNDKLNTSHLGISGFKNPIYVVEHLSVTNKNLHAAARMKAKEKNYRYVWVKNGRVFMRKTEDSAFVLIKDMDTLSKLT